VLHECFTGVAAFQGDSTLAVSAKVLLHDPPPLRALDPSVPPALDELVAALLARRPDQRPASAAAVERALIELGTLPATLHRAGALQGGVATKTVAGPPRAVCGVLVAQADDDPPWVLPSTGGAAVTVAPFDHSLAQGLAMIVDGELAVAARLALAIAAAHPGAQLVVAAGASAGDCIDRCARALADLEIATQLADPRGGAGVWIDRGAIDELAGAFRLAVSGGHARIVGPASELP